jgi:hypothetical protein
LDASVAGVEEAVALTGFDASAGAFALAVVFLDFLLDDLCFLRGDSLDVVAAVLVLSALAAGAGAGAAAGAVVVCAAAVSDTANAPASSALNNLLIVLSSVGVGWVDTLFFVSPPLTLL